VNERRCRARFCSTFSMMDILSRDKPLILDVRQNGSGPDLDGSPQTESRQVSPHAMPITGAADASRTKRSWVRHPTSYLPHVPGTSTPERPSL